MTICRQWTLVKTTGNIAEGTPLLCRSWTCDHCRPLRQKQLIATAIGGHPDTFITLTSKRQTGKSPTAAAREIVAAWRIIRRILIKQGKNGSVPFLAVFERTKMGWPHLHILARSKWIDQGWLANMMKKLTGSPIVWIERITNPKKMAAYVAKYCGKDPYKFETLKRYWHSKDWNLEPEPEDNRIEETPPVFEVVPIPPSEWAASRASLGWWTVQDGEAWRAIHIPSVVRERRGKEAALSRGAPSAPDFSSSPGVGPRS